MWFEGEYLLRALHPNSERIEKLLRQNMIIKCLVIGGLLVGISFTAFFGR